MEKIICVKCDSENLKYYGIIEGFKCYMCDDCGEYFEFEIKPEEDVN